VNDSRVLIASNDEEIPALKFTVKAVTYMVTVPQYSMLIVSTSAGQGSNEIYTARYFRLFGLLIGPELFKQCRYLILGVNQCLCIHIPPILLGQ
jgi:hypothetical protein